VSTRTGEGAGSRTPAQLAMEVLSNADQYRWLLVIGIMADDSTTWMASEPPSLSEALGRLEIVKASLLEVSEEDE